MVVKKARNWAGDGFFEVKSSCNTVPLGGTCEADKVNVGEIGTATHHDCDGDLMLLALVSLNAKEGLAGVETADTCRAYSQTADIDERVDGGCVQVEWTGVG